MPHSTKISVHVCVYVCVCGCVDHSIVVICQCRSRAFFPSVCQFLCLIGVCEYCLSSQQPKSVLDFCCPVQFYCLTVSVFLYYRTFTLQSCTQAKSVSLQLLCSQTLEIYKLLGKLFWSVTTENRASRSPVILYLATES
jgi:hypothetical protein